MRGLVVSAIFLSTCSLVGAQDPFDLTTDIPTSSQREDDRYQMLAIKGRAMLLDRESGKTWLLAAKGDQAAWIPIQKLTESTVASNWLKANLPTRPNARRVGEPTLAEAMRQVRLEEITDSKVAAEPFTVLVARARAELTGLKRQYGARHPEVVASRTRLVELLKAGQEADGK